jgi:Overcoming lysogenization defect protein-like, TOPRIM domain
VRDRAPLDGVPIGASTVVLVEGTSDEAAVRTLAERRSIDLAALRVDVVPIGGATNISHFLERALERGLRVTGLCDVGEAPGFLRAVQRARLGNDLGRAGFFVCTVDLEDELIRSLGTANVEHVLDAEGDLESFRRFQKQPAQRERPLDHQLRRFMGTRSGRKIWYGHVLVEALDLDRVPPPLDAVLDAVT